jgi:hypothetical protein
MGIEFGDVVVAHKDVVERAKGMKLDISGEGTVEQLKDTGMSTEQALVSFPNHRCWIYTNEISKAFGENTEEEISEIRKNTILDMLERVIQYEHVAINHYYGLMGTSDALHVKGSDITRKLTEEIIKDRELTITKLDALHKKLVSL